MALDSIALLAGPPMLGFFLNWALLGVLNVQVYLYFLNFPLDRSIFKWLTAGILAFEWAQTGLITAEAFNAFVYNYGDINALLSFRFAWFGVPIMGAFVSAVVQCCFAWRVFILSRSYILSTAIVVLALAQAGAGIAGGVKMHSSTAADLGPAIPLLITWLAGSALVDILIAITMTSLLLRARTGIRSTDVLLNKIIRLTVESGSLTAVVAVIDLIVANVPSLKTSGLMYECPSMVLTKLYANTFLTNLNSRAFMRQNGSMAETIRITRLDPTIDSRSHIGHASRGEVGLRTTTIVYDEHNKARTLHNSFEDTAMNFSAV